MIPHRLEFLTGTFGQHDFEGRRLFQHRSAHKWDAWGENRRIPGFIAEEKCLQHLDEIAGKLTELPGGIRRFSQEGRAVVELAIASGLSAQRFEYERVGRETRPMRFKTTGTVGEGAKALELYWDLSIREGCPTLSISGAEGLIFDAEFCPDGCWRGRWLLREKCEIVLRPMRSE